MVFIVPPDAVLAIALYISAVAISIAYYITGATRTRSRANSRDRGSAY